MNNKEPVIIIDLDETLSSSKKRSHKTPNNKAKATDEEWQRLMEGCENDPPISSMVGIARSLRRAYTIIVLTARCEYCRKPTEQWLSKNGVFYQYLFMRPDDNKQDPWDFKKNELQKLMKEYDVIALIDDESKTCEMAKELGIFSLRVV